LRRYVEIHKKKKGYWVVSQKKEMGEEEKKEKKLYKKDGGEEGGGVRYRTPGWILTKIRMTDRVKKGLFWGGEILI